MFPSTLLSQTPLIFKCPGHLKLSGVCDNRVTGNPPNRVGGTPIEGLAGLVRARARRGPSSRQKYIRLAFLAIFLYKMLVA